MIDFEALKWIYQNVPVEEYPNRVCEAVPSPVVSVHVSTYQHVDFISDCLDGILMQETTFPVEILIGEDESSDGTREICMKYADGHPEKIRLFLHRRENNIHIHGRPTPIFQETYTQFMGRGKYIAVCEGDDYWTDPLKLQKQVEFLETHKDYVMVYQPCVNHLEDIDDKYGYLDSDIRLNFLDTKLDYLITWPKTLTLLYRNIIDKYPDEYFYILNGDTFLILYFQEIGKIRCINELRPAVRRIHNGGIWSMHDRKKRSFEDVESKYILYKIFYKTKVEMKARRELSGSLSILIMENIIHNRGNLINNFKKIGYYLFYYTYDYKVLFGLSIRLTKYLINNFKNKL